MAQPTASTTKTNPRDIISNEVTNIHPLRKGYKEATAIA
jgi:hypothetical protein